MKKNFFYTAALCLSLAFTATACSDDDDDPETPGGNPDPANIEYTGKNANSWHNYSKVVARLLKTDSQKLYDEWTTHYAEEFKTLKAGYSSHLASIEQILDGCSDIADEVGNAKLGDPYNLYMKGDKTAALYAVESWYSWHSKEDYSNNIVSVQNAYYGQRNQTTGIDNVEYNEHSMAALVNAKDPEFHKAVDQAIKKAYKAIMNIPTPFRNHIGSAETKAAMEACNELDEFIKTGSKNLKGFMRDNYGKAESDAALEAVVRQYVDAVVIPTYTDLKNKNNDLCDVVDKLAANPTNENFKAACDAWIVAREPWEESEAFLFGPVADFGLDPNMDSWPLDQAAIVNILNSGKFDNLDWDGDYSEENEEIANKQSVRGFHTLEFLLFKDGQARKVK